LKNYIIEIDTTELFDSPLKKVTQVKRKGGTIEWTPDVNWSNETVYYWRISPDSIGRGQYTWRGASFVFIEQHAPGWNQSHFYQFLYDDFTDMGINDKNRRWEFDRALTDIKVKNLVVNTDLRDNPTINRNGLREWEYWDHTRRFNPRSDLYRSGVYVTLYEPSRITPVLNPSPGLYGSRNETQEDYPVFAFETARYDQRVSLMNFLENVVPDGYYVVFTTIREPSNYFGIDKWASDRDSSVANSLIDVLEDQGATLIGNLPNVGEVPYVFIYQKNNTSFTPRENYGTETDIMEVNAALPGFVEMGTTASVIIGPASSWDQYLWNNSEVQGGQDNFYTEISGINTTGLESILFDSITAASVDLSGIDVLNYPYLKLKLFSSDTVDLSSPQLNFWRISHESLPDLAIDGNDHFYFYNDTLLQGEDLLLSFSVKNVSQYPMDSLTVRYTFIDYQNTEIVIDKMYPELPPDEQLTLDLTYNTADMQGDYRLFVEVNPDRIQPELYLFNNSFVLPFFVLKDDRNPLLDVTFDGSHILDGDLVSAYPEINIRLTDENKFLPLNDTAAFDIQLLYPGEFTPRQISFSDIDLTFIPGTKANNKASVILKKRFTQDGIYKLIVNGSDISGNIAGDVNYHVTFEVVTESSISELINYPNPFTTSTRFVYTLTGDQSPDFFKIQIMTISGKVVREIDQYEIGPLKVGKHLTDYVYNGTDQFGDRLANGVYLYRLITKDVNGDQLKKRDIGISDYFKNGWGKMVILH
jgi:hypothetical protein